MSIIMLMLFILAVAGGCGILYFSYKMFRQGLLEDEASRRERLEKEAAYAAEVESRRPRAKTKANEESEATLLTERAQAEANRLKVSAGLTPQERAEYEMKTRIGVAAELAKTKFPDNMIVAGGGAGGNGGSNPFDAIGMNSLYDLSQKMSGRKKNDE